MARRNLTVTIAALAATFVLAPAVEAKLPHPSKQELRQLKKHALPVSKLKPPKKGRVVARAAHGHGDCRAYFPLGNSWWPASWRLPTNFFVFYGAGGLNDCAARGIDTPYSGAAFWGYVNNTAAYVIVWNQAGRAHVCLVDRDQVWVSNIGQWSAGVNVNCTNN